MLIYVSLGALIAPDICLGRVRECGPQNCHLASFISSGSLSHSGRNACLRWLLMARVINEIRW